jgi:hypothetical protein
MAILTGAHLAAPCNDLKRSTTALASLGSKALDESGNEYRYIKAGAAIAATDAVRFQGSALGYDDVRPISAVAQPVIGIATAAFASGDYGYVLVNGVGSVKTAGAIAANVALVSSAVAGTLAAYAAADITAPVVTVLVNSATPQVCKIAGL